MYCRAPLTLSETFTVSSPTINTNIAKQICIHKLKLYKCVENITSQYKEYGDEWMQSLSTVLRNEFPQYLYYGLEKPKNLQLKIGKFCHELSFHLLFTFCSHRENFNFTKYFIDNEVRLFVFRYLSLSLEERNNFLLENNLLCSAVERNAVNICDFKEIYEINWKSVPLLTSQREIVLKNGRAFIDKSHIPHAVAFEKTRIINRLFKAYKIYTPMLMVDPRMQDLFIELEKVANKLTGNEWMSVIDEDEINSKPLLESGIHFPPCMRDVINYIEDRNHLRHLGRQQLLPFLKDVGLSVDNAIAYFKNMFLRKMSEDEFARKKYEYYIKHQYGLLGSRIQFQCFNCSTIRKISMEANLSSELDHGCPFVSKERILKTDKMKTLSTEEKEEILDLINMKLYSKACAKEYSFTHEKTVQEIVNPVQYYALSVKEKLHIN